MQCKFFLEHCVKKHAFGGTLQYNFVFLFCPSSQVALEFHDLISSTCPTIRTPSESSLESLQCFYSSMLYIYIYIFIFIYLPKTALPSSIFIKNIFFLSSHGMSARTGVGTWKKYTALLSGFVFLSEPVVQFDTMIFACFGTKSLLQKKKSKNNWAPNMDPLYIIL